ncbi:MAG: RnfABCDGE type electron transport complex subunit D [Clostridia bacterium]|nr:RnfABCDGE type electron transport complex subunit D [Clostridia bacterium]
MNENDKTAELEFVVAESAEKPAEAPAEKPKKRVKKKSKASFPKLLTVSPSPHLKSAETTRSVMIEVMIALTPALIWGIYVFGLRALTLTVISVGCCVGFEALTQLILKRRITVSDMSAALTGMLIAMNMPVSVPLWIPVVASAFAIIVVKQLFGGIGKNIVNPAMAARVFVMICWAGQMTKNTAPGAQFPLFGNIKGGVDAVTAATPLASLKQGVLPRTGLLDLLAGNTGGCIGEVSAALLILGGIYLLIRKIISWRIPVAFIGTVAVLTFIFPQAGERLDFMLYEILSGGLMLGAIYMATDYATSPISPTGRIVFGVGCGAITVLIRYFGGYPEGVSFAILIMNLLVWYIDNAFMPRRFGSELAKKREREKEEKKA